MQMALRLARKGTGKVSPNPRVGCVVVKNGQVISSGYHPFWGGPHAEQMALANLSPEACAGASLFVTLEPCDHVGKTPPCTEAILRSGIRHVVVGTKDPNPLVNGKGIRRLQNAGIQVEVGVLEKKCQSLIEAYTKWIQTKKPFVTLKIAQTLDGKIALPNGTSQWITSEQARVWVHQLRKEHDAILVGIGTVLQDNPQLTVRTRQGKRIPHLKIKRIVLDSTLRIPETANLLSLEDPENTVVVVTTRASKKKIQRLQNKGIQVWTLNADGEGKIDLRALLSLMGEKGICSVLVEGGSKIWSAFLRSGEVDRIVVVIAPKIFGKGLSPFSEITIHQPEHAWKWETVHWRKLGNELLFMGEKLCLPES